MENFRKFSQVETFRKVSQSFHQDIRQHTGTKGTCSRPPYNSLKQKLSFRYITHSSEIFYVQAYVYLHSFIYVKLNTIACRFACAFQIENNQRVHVSPVVHSIWFTQIKRLSLRYATHTEIISEEGNVFFYNQWRSKVCCRPGRSL